MNEMEEIAVNEVLQEIVQNSHKCAHCQFLHLDENEKAFCFFAYACLTHDFYYLKDDE